MNQAFDICEQYTESWGGGGVGGWGGWGWGEGVVMMGTFAM